MDAWDKLRAFIEGGATEHEVTAYARELGRDLPDVADPVAFAQHADALAHVVRDILGGVP